MTVLPVIVRELRASSRQPFTYYLRLLAAGALLLMGLTFGFELDLTSGRELFVVLHRTLLGAIWVLGPLLTADCLSRERREGTLGLLFLTPLSGSDIVIAKGLAHALRAMALGLAVLPILAIPFLLGGISWSDAALSVALNASAICWALAAGLLASAWSKVWLRALLVAAILAFAFAFLLVIGVGFLLLITVKVKSLVQPGFPSGWTVDLDWREALSGGFGLFLNEEDAWAYCSRCPGTNLLGWTLGQTALATLLMLVTAVRVAGRKVRSSWQDESPSARRLWWRQTFCTPVLWLRFFRRWMRRRLERNPIGWLEQRTWSGRLVTWGWFGVLISIYIAALADPRSFVDDVPEMHTTLAWLLAGSMAMSAAGSFRRERENGVLELLLVSPVAEKRIILGRLGGIWGQFAPTAGLLLAVWCYFSSILPRSTPAGVILYFAATFLSVPVFGLYFSLRCRTFLSAFLFTVAAALLLPPVLIQTLKATWILWVDPSEWASFTAFDFGPSWPAMSCQLLLALACGTGLYRRLKKRAFPLERT